jgi:3D (Asp-Asp-Asp) domain-containing protein
LKKLLIVLSFALVLFLGTSLESSAASNTYTVKSGDTLYKISKTHKVSVSNLKSWNKLKSDTIHPKQKLKVKGTAVKTAAKAKTPSRSTSSNVVKEFTVSASAYTASCAGCSGITKTGINLKKNPGLKVIAVDPRVIKLGTKVYVDGYGYAVAGDTGGAIKGNKIDVFIPTKSAALKWGRKNVKIKILK